MSYSMTLIGKDKEKLKEAVRKLQVKEGSTPEATAMLSHSGVPKWVADHLCDEIDRVRIYTYQDRQYGLIGVDANGSHHEQGNGHTMSITAVQLVE